MFDCMPSSCGMLVYRDLTSKETKVEFLGTIKGMLTIFKWPKHLIVLNFVNSGITINKMAKVLITLIS